MKIKINKMCPFCRGLTTIIVEQEAYNNYINGALVQDAFPHMDLTDRETLISGMCPDCQADFFCEEDEEVDDDDWGEW